MRRTILSALTSAAALVAAVSLASCSGNAQNSAAVPVTAALPQAASPVAVGPVVSGAPLTYVDVIGGTVVYGYRRDNETNGAPVCTVGPFTSLNGGLGVDRSGNLWVPDEGAGPPRTISEYGPNCGALKVVLLDQGDVGPNNVAFDSKGHVYVSNSFANSGGPGNILQYTGTSVTRTLADAEIDTPQGLAVDKDNNVWVSYRDPGSSGTYVAEFKHGNMPAKLFKNISLGFPGSLQFDRNQNLLAVDDNFSALDVYAPPYTQSQPTTRIVLENGRISDPSMCTLQPNQAKLYCTFAAFSVVNVFTYPAGKFLYTYGNGLSGQYPYDIANDPASKK